MNPTPLPRPFVFILACLLFFASQAISREWVRIDGCRLDTAWGYNDGDSFRVILPDGNRAVFRLYAVDTPETDLEFRQRVSDQAEYFGITLDSAVEIGAEAKSAARAALSNGFTVWTKYEDALGRSQRSYAFIAAPFRDGHTDLGQALVSWGLARIHGKRVHTPGTSTADQYLATLRQAEANAKANLRGAWRLSRQ